MSAALYDNGATTVLILPLAAMHDEYQGRAKRCGLGCKTWSTSCDIGTAPQLLLVAVENCPWPELQDHIGNLIRLGRLARIVVDEAHLLAKHESFRPCMGMLSFFGMLAVSLVLMTATCPARLEAHLFQKLGRNVYRVVRRSTDRPEICQKMIAIASGGDFERTVAENIKSTISFSSKVERALLFCTSRKECDHMAELLSWKPYHSSISIEERLRWKKLWRDGGVLGLACTSMLNCCLDYSDVRYVFHLGSPRDAVDYYQAIGRAARSGGVGETIVYFNPASLKKPTGLGPNDDLFGRQAIYDMLCDTSLCRRLRPGIFLDGIGIPCAMLSHAQLCDICSAQFGCTQPDQALYRIPEDLAHPALPPVDVQKQLTRLPDPLLQPAPSATFGIHLAAANSCLAAGKAAFVHANDLGSIVRTASNNLAKSCANCWSNGLEYHSHPLDECRWRPFELCSAGGGWKEWRKSLRLPVGCCFFCGCPLKVCSKSNVLLCRQLSPYLDGLCVGFWSKPPRSRTS